MDPKRPDLKDYLYAAGAVSPSEDLVEQVKREYLAGTNFTSGGSSGSQSRPAPRSPREESPRSPREGTPRSPRDGVPKSPRDGSNGRPPSANYPVPEQANLAKDVSWTSITERLSSEDTSPHTKDAMARLVGLVGAGAFAITKPLFLVDGNLNVEGLIANSSQKLTVEQIRRELAKKGKTASLANKKASPRPVGQLNRAGSFPVTENEKVTEDAKVTARRHIEVHKRAEAEQARNEKERAEKSKELSYADTVTRVVDSPRNVDPIFLAAAENYQKVQQTATSKDTLYAQDGFRYDQLRGEDLFVDVEKYATSPNAVELAETFKIAQAQMVESLVTCQDEMRFDWRRRAHKVAAKSPISSTNDEQIAMNESLMIVGNDHNMHGKDPITTVNAGAGILGRPQPVGLHAAMGAYGDDGIHDASTIAGNDSTLATSMSKDGHHAMSIDSNMRGSQPFLNRSMQQEEQCGYNPERPMNHLTGSVKTCLRSGYPSVADDSCVAGVVYSPDGGTCGRLERQQILQKTRDLLDRQSENQQMLMQAQMTKDILHAQELSKALNKVHADLTEEKEKNVTLSTEIANLKSEKEALQADYLQIKAKEVENVHTRYMAWKRSEKTELNREVDLLRRHRDDQKNELATLRKQQEKSLAELKQKERTAQECELRLDEFQHQLDDYKRSCEQQLKRKDEDMERLRQDSETEIARIEAQYKHIGDIQSRELESQRQHYDKEIERMQKRTDEQAGDLQTAEKRLDREVKNLEEQLKFERERFDAREVERDELIASLRESHRLELKEIRDRFQDEAQRQAAEISSLSQVGTSIRTSAGTQIAEAQQKVENLESELLEKKREIDRLNRTNKELEHELEDASGMRKKVNQMKQDLKQRTEECEEFRNQHRIAQAEILAMKKRYNEEMTNLRDFSNSHAESLQNEIDILKTDRDRLKTQLEEERDRLQKQHTERTSSMSSEFETNLAGVEERYLAEMNRLIEKYEKQLADRDASHQDAQQRSTEKYTGMLDDLERRLRTSVETSKAHAQKEVKILSERTVKREEELLAKHQELANLHDRQTQQMKKNHQAEKDDLQRKLEQEKRVWMDRHDNVSAEKRAIEEELNAHRLDRQSLSVDLQQTKEQHRHSETQFTLAQQENAQLKEHLSKLGASASSSEEQLRTMQSIWESKLASIQQEREFQLKTMESALNRMREEKDEEQRRAKQYEAIAKEKSEHCVELEMAVEQLSMDNRDLEQQVQSLGEGLERFQRNRDETYSALATVQRDVTDLAAELKVHSSQELKRP